MSLFRPFSSRVWVQGVPQEWNENDINARFSVAGAISQVHFVKNQNGQKTGKLVLTFEEE